jgi:GT2 family glycosyltransferase
MADPLVSVITPCYRQGRYLPAAVETVRRQTYRPIEHVIVNDGSDDDTDAVARRYGDQIRYLAQPNRGSPAARNAGIAAAAGRYLLFLDADDLLHPEGVAWLVDAMAGREDRVCLMGFRKFQSADALDDQPGSLPPAEGPLAPRLLFGNLGPPHAHLCSRSQVQAIGGFDDRWRYGCEDWDLWLRLALAGAEFVRVPRLGAYYRRHEGTVSTNRARMQSLNTLRFLQSQSELRERPEVLRRWGLTLAEVRRRQKPLLQEALLTVAYDLRKQGDYRGCLVNYLRSIRWGGWSREAVRGLLKLGPQFVLGR